MGVLLSGGAVDSQGFWSSLIGLSPTTSGERVTEGSALSLPAYYACLKVISEDAAKLPLRLMVDSDGQRREESAAHPVSRFLRNQHPYTTTQAVREALFANAAGWGFGVAEIVTNAAGRPVALYPIHSSRVTPRVVMGSMVWDINVDDIDPFGRKPGSVVRLLDDEVFCVRGFGTNGLVGLSVLQYAAESIGLGLATQKFGAAFFGNGASPSVVLTSPNRLRPDAAENLRTSWQNAHGGADKSRKAVVLEEGITIEPYTVDPSDGQFLETRQFQIEEVCRWFRMPPVMIQHNQDTPYSNIEALDGSYVKNTLMPWLMRYEQEAERKLLLPRERISHSIRHNVEGQLRGSSKDRAEFLRTMTSAGIMTINEARSKETLAPQSGGDSLFIQSGMTTVSAVAEGRNLRGDGNNPQPPGEPGRPAASAIAAVEPMVRAVASRALNREGNALARLSGKHDRQSDEFAALAADFYGRHVQVMADNFKPVCQSWLVLSGASCTAAVTAYCEEHCERDPCDPVSPESMTADILRILEGSTDG